MAQACLHAALGYQFQRIIPSERRLLPAVIFGAILPDLDIVVVAIGSLFYPISYAEKLFHRSFSHSFFTLIAVYLLCAIIAEWKKRPVFKSIGQGLVLGMLSHIILDTFLWFREIQFLWPLPLTPFNLWNFWEVPDWIHRTMLVLEFFCFRWYAWFLTTKHLSRPNKQSWIIKYLHIWKYWETIFFIFFSLLALWNPPIFLVLFGAAYIPSLIMALWATYMSRDTLESLPIAANQNCN